MDFFLYETFQKFNEYMAHQTGLGTRKQRVAYTPTLTSFLQSSYVADFVKSDKHLQLNDDCHRIVFDSTIVNIWFGVGCHARTKQHLIRFVCMSIFFLNRWSNTTKTKVDILLLFSNQAKVLHSEKRPLTASDINSGVSQCNEGSIIVYRKEEMMKVILHELIHCYGLEGDFDVAKDREIQEKFNIQSEGGQTVRAVEATTDALACMFRIGLAILEKYPTMTRSLFVSKFRSSIKASANYFVEVANKVANHSMNHANENTWIEKTHAFSYYMIKSWIFLDVYRFGKQRYDVYDFLLRKKGQGENKILKVDKNIAGQSIRMLKFDI